MSTLKVEVVRVEKVEPHPNAYKLDIAHIKGWQCVVGRDEFKEGEHGFYFPLDAVLPDHLLEFLFASSKIKPPSRIKTIKLRGAISQGLIVKGVIQCAGGGVHYGRDYVLGVDMTEFLGVTKYEPPQKELPNLMKTGQSRVNHPGFQRFTDVENWKNYPKVFQPGDSVIVTEKIHGTNFRCGWVPLHANTPWKRFKKFFGFVPEYEFVYGSRNVELADHNPTYYGKNVYAEIVERYGLRDKLKFGEVLYGEIYGDGIQKGYGYGLTGGQHRLAGLDMTHHGEWMHAGTMRHRFTEMGIDGAPLLYCGRYVEMLVLLASGASHIGGQPVREGVVIRSMMGDERCPLLGRKILKVINDDYLLLKDNTDWH